MEGSKTLFCSSKFLWPRKRLSSKVHQPCTRQWNGISANCLVAGSGNKLVSSSKHPNQTLVHPASRLLRTMCEVARK